MSEGRFGQAGKAVNGLKPCPFCAGPATFYENPNGCPLSIIACDLCGAASPWGDTVEDVSARWNKRASQ